MKKGKFGLSTAAIAVIAFGFAALRQPTSVLLVCGFALLAEKDEWLNRQVMQALLLTIAYYLVDMVVGWVFGILASFFGWVRLYGVANAMNTAGSFVGSILYIAMIVFAVLAALRVIRGKDAKLPIIEKMASGDISEAFKTKTETSPVSPQATSPVQMPASIQATSKVQASPPAQTPPPVHAAPTIKAAPHVQAVPVNEQSAPTPQGQQAVPVQAARVEAEAVQPPNPAVRQCSACSAPLQAGMRFCTECGAKVE